MHSHCGRIGHTIDVCFRKHGYPPGYKFHNINSSVTGDMQVTAIDQQSQDTHAPSFTSQQYQALLALLQQASHGASSSTPRVNQIGTFSPCLDTSTSTNLGNLPHLFCNSVSNSTAPWILDSGATDHVSSSLANFSSYVSINPILFKLPIGQEVLATHSGVVKFSYSFLLTNVLYIPYFTFNLISISKLPSSLNCKLTFFSNKCFIQDAITKRMIGTVDVVTGLYMLNASPILHSVNNTVSTTITEPLCNKLPIDLWHLRLGHLSHDRMFLLKQYFPFLTVDKTFTCNTCHNAKQRKLPFPKVNYMFHLLYYI